MEDSCRELDAVLEGRVEGVDDGGLVVALPVGLVDLLPDLTPHVRRAPLANLDPVLEVLLWRNLKVLN